MPGMVPVAFAQMLTIVGISALRRIQPAVGGGRSVRRAWLPRPGTDIVFGTVHRYMRVRAGLPRIRSRYRFRSLYE